MSKKLKNFILFGIFIAILFISTLSSQFGTEILWSNENKDGDGFNGLLFKNPVEISDLVVSRSIESKNSKELVRYDIEFDFSGEESSLRILGTPVRQIFFDENITLSHIIVKLKGDYDKVNDQLFNEKLKHSQLYKNVSNYKFKANSEIRVPLSKDVEKYSFSIYYEPRNLVYNGKENVAKNTVFITNARVDKFVNSEKNIEGENPYFNQSGFYVNAQEILNKSAISRISIINNVSSVVFVASIIIVLIITWLDKKKLKSLYTLLLMLILLTFYRFLGLGESTLAILTIYPILAFVGACIAKLMSKNEVKLSKKDLKQNLGYTILFFVVTLIVCIIPRAM